MNMQANQALIDQALASIAHVPDRLKKLANPVVINGKVHWSAPTKDGKHSHYTGSPAQTFEMEKRLQSAWGDGVRVA